MISKLIEHLNAMANKQWYWIANISAGLSFMIVALLYQYNFEYDPCVMCIQIRLWVSLWIIVSIIGLIMPPIRPLKTILHLSIVSIAVAMVERSYQLLGTERGFVFGDCGFELGLPSWFAIDEWMPSIYRIETSCGYTPELIFGISMAEFLMVFSVAFLLLSLCVSLVYLIRPNRH